MDTHFLYLWMKSANHHYIKALERRGKTTITASTAQLQACTYHLPKGNMLVTSIACCAKFTSGTSGHNSVAFSEVVSIYLSVELGLPAMNVKTCSLNILPERTFLGRESSPIDQVCILFFVLLFTFVIPHFLSVFPPFHSSLF